jgi:hypothetical protein
MSVTDLRQPVVEPDTIRAVNFFNGRLLTGEDLSREQQAGRRARALLGTALGDGVAFGLEASEALGTSSVLRPLLHVEAGVAVNREGVALELVSPVDIALTREEGGGDAGNLLFAECQPVDPGAYTAGTGVYLLTIGPSERREGLAPVSGLPGDSAECNTASRVEAVQFRLLRLGLTAADMSDFDRLRNRLAHLAYGTYDSRQQQFGDDPFGPSVRDYGLIDAIAGDCLTPDQVPLATLLWTADGGLRFVDRWSVRRRVTRRPVSERFPVLTGDRRLSESEAMLLQFEDQVEDMLRTGADLSQAVAADAFEHLPPVGVLPVAGDGSPRGFDARTFLGDQASLSEPTLDAAVLRELVHDSFFHEPIAVGGAERVQIYRLWDSDQAVEGGTASQRAAVFAKATLRYRGTARYGHARYGRDRFAASVV